MSKSEREEKLEERCGAYKGQVKAGATEIRELRRRILDAELALNVWDKSHESEYWLRHPTPMSPKIEG